MNYGPYADAPLPSSDELVAAFQLLLDDPLGLGSLNRAMRTRGLAVVSKPAMEAMKKELQDLRRYKSIQERHNASVEEEQRMSPVQHFRKPFLPS